jgi:hypothetical protein
VCGELCCSVEFAPRKSSGLPQCRDKPASMQIEPVSPHFDFNLVAVERGLEIENLKGVMLLRVLNGSTSASTTGHGIANRVPGLLAHSSSFGLGASVRRIGESCGSSGYAL